MLDLENLLRLRQLDVTGRRVFVRADLDALRSPQGAVQEDLPLRILLPTIRYLIGLRAKVVLATTLGSASKDAARVATAGISERLAELLGSPVRPLGWSFERELRDLTEGQVAIAPDLSAIPEDAAHDLGWATQVAAAIDVYVLEGLRAARDGGASVHELAKLVPSRGVGYTIDPALEMYHDVISAPAPEPFTFVLGGGGLRRLALLARAVMENCKDVLLGGAVANTFLVAQGWRPGSSPHEPDAVDIARELLKLAKAKGVTIHSPIDAVLRLDRRTGEFTYEDRALDRALESHEAVVDIGLETCNAYRDVLAKSATVLWVGLMGDCSVPETQRGSLRTGMAASEAARPMAAGEETVDAVKFFRLDRTIRTAAGGDAVVSLLAGAPFPGLDALGR